MSQNEGVWEWETRQNHVSQIPGILISPANNNYYYCTRIYNARPFSNNSESEAPKWVVIIRNNASLYSVNVVVIITNRMSLQQYLQYTDVWVVRRKSKTAEKRNKMKKKYKNKYTKILLISTRLILFIYNKAKRRLIIDEIPDVLFLGLILHIPISITTTLHYIP